MATANTGMSGRIKASMKVTGEKDVGLSVGKDPLVLEESITVSFGTADGKMNEMWHDQRTLALSTSEDLDLFGTLENIFGDIVNFAVVDAIFVKNTSVNSCVLEVGPPAANGFGVGVGGAWKAASDANILQKDAAIMLLAPPAGWAVTAGTGDLLTINNTTAEEALYEIAIIGRVAA